MIMVLLLFVVLIPAASAAAFSNDDIEGVYAATVAAIKKAAEERDGEALAVIADEISRTWLRRDAKYYGNLSQVFVQSVATPDGLGEDQVAALARQVADHAIEHREKVRIDSLYRIVVSARTNFARFAGVEEADRSLVRKRDVRRCLILLDETYGRQDPNFDPRVHRAYGNIMPPPEVEAGFAGMDPNSIEDPELRKIYEQRIADAAKETRYYSEQVLVRRISATVFEDTIRHLAYLYSRDIAELEEFEALLAEHVRNDEIRSEILAAVQEKVKQ